MPLSADYKLPVFIHTKCLTKCLTTGIKILILTVDKVSQFWRKFLIHTITQTVLNYNVILSFKKKPIKNQANKQMINKVLLLNSEYITST